MKHLVWYSILITGKLEVSNSTLSFEPNSIVWIGLQFSSKPTLLGQVNFCFLCSAVWGFASFGKISSLLMKLQRSECQLRMVRRLLSSQAHCVKSHHGRLALIVQSLFTSTEDELVKTVKSRVFGVENGEPILAPDHPVLRELATLSNGACAWRLACLCFALTLAPPPSRNRQARAFREW